MEFLLVLVRDLWVLVVNDDVDSFDSILWNGVKNSVWYKYFYMTFTALIASISHILIHPVIILEKWDIMLVCIIVTSISSIISARFANRVKNRTLGIVTGIVLTVLCALMILLNYWDLFNLVL